MGRVFLCSHKSELKYVSLLVDGNQRERLRNSNEKKYLFRFAQKTTNDKFFGYVRKGERIK